MKRPLLICAFLALTLSLRAQYEDAVSLFMASAEHFSEAVDFSGDVSWHKRGGVERSGTFTVWGEHFRIVWDEGEMRGDGEYLWEIDHRTKRIKRRHYNPTLAPAVVSAFRFYRLDLLSEAVVLAGTPPEVYIEVEYGASIAQGHHQLRIDTETLAIEEVILHENMGDYHEKATIRNLTTDSDLTERDYRVDAAEWKKKGYSFLDLARGLPEIMPEEKALKER